MSGSSTQPSTGPGPACSAMTPTPTYSQTPQRSCTRSPAITRLVDGNKRLAWLATYVFLAKNDVVLDPPDDDAYELVVGVTAGDVDDVPGIAGRLARWIE